MIGDGALQRLAQQHGSPLYIYSLGALRRRIADLRAAFDYERFSLYFATMANDTPSILATIAAEGVGACVNSMRHLDAAWQHGFRDLQFTSTGVPRSDMEHLIGRGVAANLDSPVQIEQWTSLPGGRRVGARLNAAVLIGRTSGDRIGMCVADLRRSIAIARSNGAAINGVHVYTGTNYLDAEAMLPILRAFFDVAADVADLEYVNIGGGIGVDYTRSHGEFDLASFGREVSVLARALSRRLARPVRMIFEPGRSLVANCGVFLTRVTDIKELLGVRYVAVDASVAVFPRPLHHPDTPHRAWIVGNGHGETGDVTVVGRTTFSRDILARTALSEHCNVGDLIAFDDAGAYCASMISRFLGQQEPPAVTVDD